MTDERLIDIETKLAHQEHLLSELNDALTSQQSQLTHLESLCQTMLARLRELNAPDAGPQDEKPPHY